LNPLELPPGEEYVKKAAVADPNADLLRGDMTADEMR